MNIAIIGAGAGGLTAAFDLLRHGHKVTIFEREENPGGLAGGFKKEEWDWSIEKYYHHWFWTDKPILKLIDELGLAENVIFNKPKTVVYHAGKFYPLDSISAVLKFPGFSLIEKIRFGLVTAYLKYISGWKNLEKFTAVNWIKKFYGENLFKIFFKPLLMGKFNEHYKDVNMAWMWARFKARSAKLGTYRGGFQAFLDDFTDILRKNGAVFKFNTTVKEISRYPNGKFSIITDGISYEQFDQVLVTLPPPLLKKLVPDFPMDYFLDLEKQKSTGAIVMIFSLNKPLSREGYYWYNLPKNSGFPFLALVEHTNFLDEERFNGNQIVYCGDYLDSSHPYFSYSKDDLAELYLSAFRKINPDFSKTWVNEFWLFKTPFAQPIPEINHSTNILNIKTPIDGLFLATISQIYPWDRGTNFAVAFAHQAVRTMLEAQTNT